VKFISDSSPSSNYNSIIDAWGSVRGLREMAKVAIEVLLVANPIARIRAGNWGHGVRCKNQQLKYV